MEEKNQKTWWETKQNGRQKSNHTDDYIKLECIKSPNQKAETVHLDKEVRCKRLH